MINPTVINLPFSIEEYNLRLQKVRQAMQQRGIDVLFVEDPSNMAWLTGYDGWSFYVHQGVIVFHDAPPMWWGRAQDAHGARRTVYMSHEYIAGYDENYVQATDKHPMQDLAQHLINHGYDNKAIGVEMDNYYFSAKAYEVLKTSLPQAHWIDATALVNWQRGVKSDTEITYMRRAAAISEAIMHKALTTIRPGLPKNQLVADIQHQAILGADGHWGDYPAIISLVPSGEETGASHLTWNDTPVPEEGITFFELSGCYRRYHAPLCRSVYFGTPPQKILDAEKALIEGLDEGIEAARNGAMASDIANALFGALRRYGIEREARCGYAIGISYPPDWGERTISLRPNDHSELKAGMTFHFMPGIWMGDWGIEITETIVINKNGAAERLNHFDQKLFVNPTF